MDENTKLEFEKALQLRNFEIDNFWKRGWFFGALLLVLITGYITLADKTKGLESGCIYISFIGVIVSLAQSLMNRGSKYWQERYEFKTKNLETALEIDITKINRFDNNERYYIDACILNKEQENILTRSARFSVSKMTFLVWDVIVLAWITIWIRDLRITRDTFCIEYLRLDALAFHIVIIVYVFLFFLKGGVYGKFQRVKNNTNDGEKPKQDYRRYLDNELS